MFYRFTLLFALYATFSLPLSAKEIVNDITGLNPIAVSQVIAPKTLNEIKEIIKSHSGPISIGGGRYSMGGQTATESTLQIDMRAFNQILKLDVQQKKIVVQTGIRWRDIQEAIDPHHLSVKIMQSYANFTVGGSLSVNAHGRYIGAGPLINSVDSIKVILADGEEVIASRSENTEIFFSAIGGYGGVGVIVEATLNLVPNEKMRREVKKIHVTDYKDYFLKHIRNHPDALLHNGDLYPPAYQNVRTETWYRTDKPLTIATNLLPQHQKYWLEPSVISSISTLPFGTELRAQVLDPLLRSKEIVVWRNYEASADVAQLEPTTPRLLFTYALQEYFVPVDNFDEFIPKLRTVLQKYNVNVINVSIRHAPPDPGTYLAWAPNEVFSFVIYYKQATTKRAQTKVKQWTRELIDQALSVHGAYYLPYQIYASPSQFQKAYPDYQKFFNAKRKYDPTNKFRNKLWDSYYQN